MDRMTVIGARVESGKWRPWEHICTVEEIEAVQDSAVAKAEERGRTGKPAEADYLDGARYIFEVAYGPRERPKDGDTRVFSIQMHASARGDDGHEMRRLTGL